MKFELTDEQTGFAQALSDLLAKAVADSQG